jgi:hypothetical protein
MTNILTDKTTGKISKINICHYCNSDIYPSGKPIIDDKNAVRTAKGDYKCGECVGEDNVKLNMRMLGRNHPMIKDYLSQKQNEINQWNKYARSVNNMNKKMGGTTDVVKLKRNPYKW